MIRSTNIKPGTIVALWYTDALFFYKKPKNWPRLGEYLTIGKLIKTTKEYILVEYTSKNNHTERGLLIPKSAIIYRKQLKKKPRNKYVSLMKKGVVVGITWKDIVYFDDGVIPKSATEMYSEGSIVSIKYDYIIFRNENTLALTEYKVRNFPESKNRPLYFAIPTSFISRVEKYEKK